MMVDGSRTHQAVIRFTVISHRFRFGELILIFRSDVFVLHLKAYRSVCVIILAVLFRYVRKISKINYRFVISTVKPT
jgi:hypothetical protein